MKPALPVIKTVDRLLLLPSRTQPENWSRNWINARFDVPYAQAGFNAQFTRRGRHCTRFLNGSETAKRSPGP